MKFRIDTNKLHLGGNVIDSEVGDPNTYYPELWKWIIDRYNIKSVLDIGCGSGHSCVAFKNIGCHVIGVDGLEDNIKDVFKNEVVGIINDYEVSHAFINESFDLCWMCEFVEHVEEKYMQNFLENVKKCRVVAMTHAIPGQTGHHHVNLKDTSYWIDIMKEYGYSLDIIGTLESKRHAGGYWTISGMIFTS